MNVPLGAWAECVYSTDVGWSSLYMSVKCGCDDICEFNFILNVFLSAKSVHFWERVLKSTIMIK